jgi:hypothetical protein
VGKLVVFRCSTLLDTPVPAVVRWNGAEYGIGVAE